MNAQDTVAMRDTLWPLWRQCEESGSAAPNGMMSHSPTYGVVRGIPLGFVPQFKARIRARLKEVAANAGEMA
jgi:hypothetical protein